MERQELSFEMGARLKSLREEKHLSYQELADALLDKYGIKISKDSLRDYEICSDYRSKAKSLPNLGMRTEYLIALSDFYEVSTDYLLCKTDCPAPEIKIREICEYTGLSEAAVLTLNQWDNPFGAGVILDMFIRSDLSDAILESIVDLRDAYIQCIGEKKR